MNRRPSVLLFVSAALVTLLLAAVLIDEFESRARALRSLQEEQLASLQKQWGREAAARKASAHQKTPKRQRELDQALGGPVESAFRNPDLTIQQMLQQTARACAPDGAAVVVRVDAFTEFEVIVTLKDAAGTNHLAEFTTCLLRHGAPYLHTLRFIHDRRVVVELDQRTLERVPDWSKASVTTAQEILASSGLAAAALKTAANDDRPPSAKEEAAELTGDRKRIQEVGDTFDREYAVQFDRINKLIEAQDFAARLDSVGHASDLDDRLKWLDENESALNSARVFLLDPEPEYRRRLNELAIDPLVVTILCRGRGERGEQQRPYLARTLDAVAERQRATKSFLSAMQSQWGNWHSDPTAGLIHFESAAARDAYNRGIAEYEQAGHTVGLAKRAWSNFNETQKGKQ